MPSSDVNVRFGLTLALLATAATACGPSKAAAPPGEPKVLVLGFDGLDPEFVARHRDRLPNLMRLAERGGFEKLETVMPPQSPVAWSTVITGLTPAGHGVFDFVHRHPQDITPFSSMAETIPPEWMLDIGKWSIPLEASETRPLRKGEAFWQVLAEHHVPNWIIKMPTDFPPLPAATGALSGMGTPDMLGSFGTFQLFTDDPSQFVHPYVSGGEIRRITLVHGRGTAHLHGPVNTFLKDETRTTAPIYVDVDPEADAARIEIGDDAMVLAVGDWSDWVQVDFEMVPWLQSATGMVRLFLVEAHPNFRLYVSPINVDPREPEVQVSTPDDFAAEVADAVGPYYTQGMAEETKGLSAHVITREQFVEQAAYVYDEEIRIYRHMLEGFDRGFMFYYFSATDQAAHMLWGDYDELLVPFYERADEVVGQTLDTIDGDTTLLVISDHGFQRFDREVNLNTYLMKEGFLALDDPANTGPTPGFVHVDWSKTRAYAMGLNGLYVNRAGREGQGIVADEDVATVKKELTASLLRMRDPDSGTQVVARMYDTEKIYPGEDLTYAPDLMVGFAPPYRMSPDTGLGAVPDVTVADNHDEWIADHCMAHDTVPGVLFSNRPVALRDPRLLDIPVTILSAFGLPVPEVMDGRNVLASP